MSGSHSTSVPAAVPAAPPPAAPARAPLGPLVRRVALLAAALGTTGCGGSGGDGGADIVVAVDTVDGVERLRYAADGGRRLGWALDTAFVLGDAFAEEEYQFNQVNGEGLAGTGDGSLLVLDRQGKRVLRYGPDGGHVATYGREGSGPGELGQPLGLVVGPGDTVWVSDLSNSRLTGYPLEGGEPRSVAFPENSGFPAPRMAALDRGHVLQFRPMFNFRRGSSGGFQMSRGDGSSEGQVLLPLVRYDRDALQPADTLWTTPEPPTDMVRIETGDRLMVQMMSREFHPDFMWAAFSDGALVISDTTAYLLRIVDPGGGVERLIQREPPPRPVTDADREAARQRVREQARTGGGVRIGGAGPDEQMQQRMLEQRLEKMTFAEVAPRVLRLGVDGRDRIWVGVSEDVAGEVARIDIYDRDGRLLGEVRDLPMPDAFLANDRVAVLRQDDLDVQQVVVLQVMEEAGEGQDR